MYRILYNGEEVYTDLSYDEVSDIIEEIASRYFDGELIDPTKIQLEEINHGSQEITTWHYLYGVQTQEDSTGIGATHQVCCDITKWEA